MAVDRGFSAFSRRAGRGKNRPPPGGPLEKECLDNSQRKGKVTRKKIVKERDWLKDLRDRPSEK
jgi:hypothetical protein